MHSLRTLLFLLLTVFVSLAGPSRAATTRTLTVYTYDSFVSKWGPGPKVKAAFEQQCGCTLNLIGLDDAVSILGRLRLEGTHSKADIALGLDSSMIHEAGATGFFVPHGLDLSGLTVPTRWRSRRSSTSRA